MPLLGRMCEVQPPSLPQIRSHMGVVRRQNGGKNLKWLQLQMVVGALLEHIPSSNS
jgi:hypothetical protein